MIELRQIRKSYVTKYETLSVLKGIDLCIEQGEMVSIMGASGSGKSTLLNILGLLDRFDEGEYLVDGQSVKGLNDDELAYLRNRKFGFVFQSANLIPQMDLLDNVILPLTYRNMPEKEMRERGMVLLERFSLADWRRHYPNELSGGQKQRVAIARAIITDPEIILADEPTGQLDSVSTAVVMDILTGINRETGATLILVTHEQGVAERAHRIVHIKDGEICAEES
jgi:ABC-type antimicrobial peptide transport system, ATPase component